jgi:crotonobetainyl-CoA:carnitine CoA-transferase CaiB-like acyl-CoA transferase
MTLLAGVRVLDATVAWAGPLAGRWLADLGAEVIHVERPTGRGSGVGPNDASRGNEGWRWGTLPEPAFRSGIYPDADPGARPWNRQGLFNKINRNKRSLCVDLKTTTGRDLFQELVQISDVVLDNWRPRALPALGLGYEELRQINPAIIACSLSGYGAASRYREHVSLGPILEAHAGLAAATGYPGGEAMKLGGRCPTQLAGSPAPLQSSRPSGTAILPVRAASLTSRSSRHTPRLAANRCSQFRLPGATRNRRGTARPPLRRKACTAAPATTAGSR